MVCDKLPTQLSHSWFTTYLATSHENFMLIITVPQQLFHKVRQNVGWYQELARVSE